MNVLSSKDVFVQEVDGNHIVVINVPRAERSYKPVYVDGNPLCTYRRNGEGDYRCTKEEYQAMVRDASVKTQDMLVLNEMDLTVFNQESVRSYRQRMRLSRPGHVWEALEDEDFLLKLGAVGIGSDGKKHPTSAGLLMFGNEYDIVREFNAYFLDYQEQYDADTRWTDRIISSSGDWSGNVYDFYFRVYNKLIQDIKVPFKMDGGTRIDDTPVHQALREALANCLVNADYYGRQGLVIVKKRNSITMSNPGSFRIEIDAAKSGGVSDPRNGTMLKMFNLIDIGERAGSGIPNIFRVWREQGWAAPTFTEQLEPERTILSLTFEKIGDKKSVIKIGERAGSGIPNIFRVWSDQNWTTPKITEQLEPERTILSLAFEKASDKKQAIKASNSTIYSRQKQSVIEYLTREIQADCKTIADLLEISSPRARAVLTKMVKEEIIITEGGNRNRTYKLKS